MIEYLNETVETLQDEAGQTMAEYAVVLGVITIAVVVTLGLLSTAIKNTLNNVIASLEPTSRHRRRARPTRARLTSPS